MLRCSRMCFCVVSTDCEVGAGPTVAPRSGLFPTLYVLAPVGFSPDPRAVHCQKGIASLNHPRSLDLSRIDGPDSAFASAHSHILADQEAGWHEELAR